MSELDDLHQRIADLESRLDHHHCANKPTVTLTNNTIPKSGTAPHIQIPESFFCWLINSHNHNHHNSTIKKAPKGDSIEVGRDSKLTLTMKDLIVTVVAAISATLFYTNIKTTQDQLSSYITQVNKDVTSAIQLGLAKQKTELQQQMRDEFSRFDKQLNQLNEQGQNTWRQLRATQSDLEALKNSQ